MELLVGGKVDAMNSLNAYFEDNFLKMPYPVNMAIHGGQKAYLYHWHDEIEVIYILTKTTAAGIENRTYWLNEGDILIIGSREVHCVFPADNSANRLVLKFNMGLLSSKGRSVEYTNYFMGVKRHSAEWDREVTEKIKNCISEIYIEFIQRKPAYTISITALIYNILRTVALEVPHEAENEAPKNEIHNLKIDRFKKILEYIAENYTRDITLKDCAEKVGFNTCYLSSLFKSLTGIAFHQYLENLRNGRAEWLLVHSQMPIKEIIFQCGYSNTKTFNRVFKRIHGVSPREYRNVNEENTIQLY